MRGSVVVSKEDLESLAEIHNSSLISYEAVDDTTSLGNVFEKFEDRDTSLVVIPGDGELSFAAATLIVLLGEKPNELALQAVVTSHLASDEHKNPAVAFVHCGRNPKIEPEWTTKFGEHSVHHVPGVSSPKIQTDIEEIVEYVERFQSDRPAIGVGLLVINESTGDLLLTRRISPPEKSQISSIGTSLVRGSSIPAAVDKLVSDKFQNDIKPQVGPLLSCTTMTDSFHHYVDMTFFATCAATPSPLLKTTVRSHGYIDGSKEMWFPLKNLLGWLTDQEEDVFAPVANAIQGLLSLVLAHRTSVGDSEMYLPRLDKANPKMLRVPDEFIDFTGADEKTLKSIRTLCAATHPLPFFETGF